MGDWHKWAERLKDYLDKTKTLLANKIIFDRLNPGEVAAGELGWNLDDDTLNIGHTSGSVQQVGFETYMRCYNNTGSTISNGTVVGFTGVSSSNPMCAPYLADGSQPNLYFIGVATTDIPTGDTHNITVYGKVRGVDTSGFSVGDILYASPDTAGALTNVRPTAPDNVIVVAAVLTVDATDGIILVRPTIPAELDYGVFTSTADQTPAAANTAYSVTFDTTNIDHGVSIVSASQITVADAGFYQVSMSLQVTSSNSSSSTVYAWLSKNGTDISNTRQDFTIKANGDTKVLTNTYAVSLDADDYIELKWAASTTNMKLDAIAATAFAPAAPSARLVINQTQL